MKPTVILALMALTAVAAGCGGKGDKPVPRPQAYPRVEVYSDGYVAADSLPAGFEMARGTVVADVKPSADGRSLWANINYPLYDATLHLTFTRVDGDDDMMEVTDNRLQRMAMNLGDNSAEEITLTNDAGYNAVVLKSHGRVPTPVQFVSASPSMVVSGAVRFSRENLNPDSLAPVVDALTADVVHAIKHMR